MNTPQAATELRGRVTRVLFRDDQSGFSILALAPSKDGEEIKAPGSGGGMNGSRRSPAAKGILHAPPVLGQDYHFIGAWKHDPRYGWGFAFEDAEPIIPDDEDGIYHYLLAHCRHLGESRAQAVLFAYGTDAISVLESDPDRVAQEINGISKERALEIQQALIDQADLRAAEVEVRGLVSGTGVGARVISRIMREYGKQSGDVVRHKPYRLIREIDGIGWKTADAIAFAAEIPRDSDERIQAGILHALHEARNEGHACLEVRDLVSRARVVLSVVEGLVCAQIATLLAAGKLVEHDDAPDEISAVCGVGRRVIYARRTERAERTVADVILRRVVV